MPVQLKVPVPVLIRLPPLTLAAEMVKELLLVDSDAASVKGPVVLMLVV